MSRVCFCVCVYVCGTRLTAETETTASWSVRTSARRERRKVARALYLKNLQINKRQVERIGRGLVRREGAGVGVELAERVRKRAGDSNRTLCALCSTRPGQLVKGCRVLPQLITPVAAQAEARGRRQGGKGGEWVRSGYRVRGPGVRGLGWMICAARLCRIFTHLAGLKIRFHFYTKYINFASLSSGFVRVKTTQKTHTHTHRHTHSHSIGGGRGRNWGGGQMKRDGYINVCAMYAQYLSV